MHPSTSPLPTTPVDPVRPIAGYVGGKRNLASTIVPLIDRAGLRCYAEPFVGMGGIFLRRRRRAAAEVINDLSGDVATLFRVLQEHYPYVIDMLRFRVAGRAEFERLRAMPPERLTDLQRAVRFLYLQRLTFGGRIEGRTFGVSAGLSSRFNVSTLEPMLADVHERLAGVVIEQLPYADFIRRYDRDDMLFYLDPPYHGSEGDYGADAFSADDFAAIAEQLAGIRGRFLLSINDTPAIRQCFAAFPMRAVGVSYTLGGGAHVKRAGELLIGTIDLG